MNRALFLKTLAVLIASPALIGTASSQSITLPKRPVKKSYFFKITEEMRANDFYMDFLLTDKNSFVFDGCKKAGMDLEKPFDYKIGWDGDDFASNCISCLIEQ